MDTLFRLVSLQSSESSRTSTSSRSSRQPYYIGSQSPEELELDQEECCNDRHIHHQYHQKIYMDEDDFSSSSSKNFPPPATPQAPLFQPTEFSFPPELNISFDFNPAASSAAGQGRWAAEVLAECARAVAGRDTARVQQLMWMLNELSSPYGDVEQKMASYFLQGLFARLTSSGHRTLRTLSSASDKTCSFDSTRRTLLRFQELSPWSSFGHVAANGAILEAFLDSGGGYQRLHILDLSTTFCTQWPTLLEALATRSADDTPHLSITTVIPAASPSAPAQRVMREVGARMEKFARLMGVPFCFQAVHHAGDLSTLDLPSIGLGGADALAVNCVNALRGVPPRNSRRDALVGALRRLNPRIVTVVEEEADLDVGDGDEGFLKGFREALRFFGSYFDSLEESFPRTSNERLALERAAGRAVVDLVACPAAESMERRETAAGWSGRMHAAGFSPAAFSDDVADDVRALLRRYREGWSLRLAGEAGGGAGMFLAWKEQTVVWTSAWRPS